MVTVDQVVWKEGEGLDLECSMPSASASMRTGYLAVLVNSGLISTWNSEPTCTFLTLVISYSDNYLAVVLLASPWML